MDADLTTCARCPEPLSSSRRAHQQYCSARCRKAAWAEANQERLREDARIRYQANRETVLERTKERERRRRMTELEQVREETRERMRRWREANPEREREQSRRRYAANPEPRRQQARDRYASDPERFRQRRIEWRKANPDKANEQKRRRRALKKGAAIVDVISLDALFQRDAAACHICKRKVRREEASVDHLIPLSQGGDHSWANVALAHHACNARRGAGRIPAQLRLVG